MGILILDFQYMGIDTFPKYHRYELKVLTFHDIIIIIVYSTNKTIKLLFFGLFCCIIYKNLYKMTTLAILKNGAITIYSLLNEDFKFVD
jgi:hypothetical protein